MRCAIAVLAISMMALPAMAAKLKMTTKFQSEELSTLVSAFAELKSQAEQSDYDTAVDFGFKIASKKPGERIESTLKQAVYKVFNGTAKPEKVEVFATDIYSLPLSQAINAAISNLSFNDASPVDDFKPYARETIQGGETLRVYRLDHGNQIGHATQLAVVDEATREVYVFGSAHSEE